ncbi:MAG: glycosyltransferase family 2 protein [Alphaproteobacteria bacterium]|nr:glycosyltransferase family 2 protein [Alphaproteobacteria bacterium]
MNNPVSAIDICLCTYRRPQVAQTLETLAHQVLPEGITARVIVADNDETPSAKELVEQTAARLGLNLTYIHAPARNISVARNACLDAATAPLIAFLDDDEKAPSNWLAALYTQIEESKADVVLGPVRANYSPEAPDWMKRGDFHATKPVWVNGEITTGYSCNVIFRRESSALKSLRFRPDLGKSGGEDTFFFDAVHKSGGKITYAPEALLEEDVTPARATLSWLARRRFRSGQTHGLLLLEAAQGLYPKRLRHIIIASAKALFSLCAAPLHIARKEHFVFWLLRATMHAGVVSRLLGKRELEQYGKETPT